MTNLKENQSEINMIQSEEQKQFNTKKKSKKLKLLKDTQKEIEQEEVKLEGISEPFQMENDSNMLIAQKKSSKSVAHEDTSRNVKEKKKLTKKERNRLEKVLERKEKSSKRNDLLEKLAAIQVNSSELKLYSSVRNIGQKEKKKLTSLNDDSAEQTATNRMSEPNRKINSIAGSNKRKKSMSETKEASSTDTDDISTDSEIDEPMIEKALANFKNKRAAPIDSDDETYLKAAPAVTTPLRVTKYVHVERRKDIQESRAKLPIITEEQLIMEKISENDIVIISGETGSGKTTQCPQFLYEAGYAEDGQIIGITEPRRVAAISMCKRVNDEMNFDESAGICSYQIRYEGNYSPVSTRIKFMTDGVLLKEVQNDFLLTKYSAIIIDEAHERSVYTDILIGLLSRIVPLRNKQQQRPLKLIIMSATLRVEDFTENKRLFKNLPPVIKVESRQYQVAVHFNKNTYEDYLTEAYRKTCKIHTRLPEGGILIFVTGQQEVNVLCNKLRRTYPFSSTNSTDSTKTIKSLSKNNDKSKLAQTPNISLSDYSALPKNTADQTEDDDMDCQFDLNDDDDAVNLNDMEDDDDDQFEDETSKKILSTSDQSKPLYVLPLYSLLSSEKQIRVFDKVPDGCRLCVVATNVAETSLTIPNIKYVIDSGKIKMKFYDKITGVSTFRVCWTSKASAEQRAGRAGRTSPGHCYRLYSSAVFNDEFPLFTEPEIARKPVEDLILQMKDLGIDRIVNFPFPTPPDETAIKVSENLLVQLGALQVDASRIKNAKDEQITKITQLGKTMANFPINPRYAKMLTLASEQEEESKKEIISYVICLISALSVPELFLDGEVVLNTNNGASGSKTKYSAMRQHWIGGFSNKAHTTLLGDLMLLLVALGAVEYEENETNCIKFCQTYGIRHKAIIEAKKLRVQLVNTMNVLFPSLNLTIDPTMPPPTQEQAKLLRQLVLSGMVDKIAKRYDHVINDSETKKEIKNAYQGLLLTQPIFIHPSSVLFKELPEYVCYVEMVETSKLYMKGLCAIEADWLPVYCANQCTFSKPIICETDPDYETKKPRFHPQKGIVVCHREATFGRVMWKTKSTEVEFPQSLELFKWFARFILEGDVNEKLKKYSTVLLASPSTMLKSWAKLQPRTETFLNALINEKCSNKQQLLQIWSTRSDYLLNEYLMWIPESLHFEIRLLWPPIENEKIK